jgi:hypothetical protein
VTSYSYSFLDQDRNCPEAARHLFILKDFKKTYTVAGGIDDHRELEKHLRNGAPLPPELAHVAPMANSFRNSGVEVEVAYAVDRDLKPINFWHENVFIRGKYDIVRHWPETRHAFLGDWKSGKIRESSDQLELGALLMTARYPTIERVTGVNVWINSGPKLGTPYEFRTEENGPRWAKWLKRIAEIEQRDAAVEWERRESGLCAYCPVKVCPNYRGG